MNKMCCPSYTIRCEALKFKATKSQKKIMKKFTRYLAYDEKPRGGGGGGEKESIDTCEDKEMEADDVASGSQVRRHVWHWLAVRKIVYKLPPVAVFPIRIFRLGQFYKFVHKS